MYNEEFIKERTERIIDTSKFHVGCAYFIQNELHGGSWITGILVSANDYELTFVIGNSDHNYIIHVDDLADPKKGYKITLLVPAFSNRNLFWSRDGDPTGYARYLGKEN